MNELLSLLAKYDDYNGINTFAMQALKLTPENIRAYYWLIYAMYHSGAIELARNEVRRAKSVLTSEEYATLCNYLEKHHKGASKTISSKKLEVVFSVTGAEIRRAVNALRCACQPICSDTSGYYFGETQKEIMATVAQLNGRVQKIAMARDGLISSIERLEDS